jgi:TonB family protein
MTSMMHWKGAGATLAAAVLIGCASRPPAPSPAGPAPTVNTERGDRELPPPVPDLPAASRPVPQPQSNEPRLESQVEMVVTIVERPKPAYPDSLRRAGIRGRVTMEYVVDTLGVVDSASVRGTNPAPTPAEVALANAARAAIIAGSYRPAQFDGRKVAQKVFEEFTFPPPPATQEE